MFKIEESGKPITPEMIGEVENRLLVRFPDGYKRFLLRHNGGFPYPDSFNFRFGHKPETSSIDLFYRIEPGHRNDIVRRNQLRAGRLPTGFVAIGPDPGGNEICICCAPGEDYGKLYFWEHELEADEAQGETPDTVENVFVIASSFEEFLQGLYKFELANET